MKKSRSYIIVVLLTLLFLSVFVNIWQYNRYSNLIQEEKIVILEKIDTIRDTIPKIIKEDIIRIDKDTFNVYKLIYDTLYLDKDIDNNYNNIDSIYSKDSLGVIVDIPISQRVYSDDSTYVAYVSGYKPQLDSINVFRKEMLIEKTFGVREKPKRWGIGPFVGVGYDISNNKVGGVIGIGVTYNIFRF